MHTVTIKLSANSQLSQALSVYIPSQWQHWLLLSVNMSTLGFHWPFIISCSWLADSGHLATGVMGSGVCHCTYFQLLQCCMWQVEKERRTLKRNCGVFVLFTVSLYNNYFFITPRTKSINHISKTSRTKHTTKHSILTEITCLCLCVYVFREKCGYLHDGNVSKQNNRCVCVCV